MALVLPGATNAADLVIAEKGVSNYQIVIPDQAVDEVVDRWLMATANLMQTAFQKSGFGIPVVREAAMSADKPGIYLGATKFAHQNKIEVHTDDWSYVWKTVGPNLVIIGSDRKDPVNSRHALLGSVKGAVDLLRQNVGTRFLFNNKIARTHREVLLDTRSVAFVPVERVSIPADLDLRKTPPLKARPYSGGSTSENFYTIANNYFPLLSVTSTRPPAIIWEDVIPLAEYGETHPEYFALLPNGKRASEQTVSYNPNAMRQVALDVTDPDIVRLMFLAAEEQIKKGATTVKLGTVDRYLLDQCNCDRCNAFFGMSAKTYPEILARGKSGKLWQIYFSIAESIQKKYPEVKVIVSNYQDTPLNSTAVQQFPANVLASLHMGTLEDFDKLKGISIPAGVLAYEETFTGFGMDGPFAPERTPEYAAQMAQAMVQHKVQWTQRDGAMLVWGLQAPVYYVYGRMIDDPTADYKEIEKEFYTAAFGESASQMTGFFDLLHKEIQLYSDFFGLYKSAWKTARAHDNYNKWVHQSIYGVEFTNEANERLGAAEKTATDPDVKARLRLIRIEFDYLSNLGKIFDLQDAWTIHPSPEYLAVLLDAVDVWHKQISDLGGGFASDGMQPVKDWPQMRPFNGRSYRDVALERNFYQNMGWQETAIGWDTAAIRAGALSDSPAPVNSVKTVPDSTSTVWEDVPLKWLRKGSDMPYTSSRTTFKVLHDQENLYVRVNSRVKIGPSGRGITKALEDLFPPKTEGDVFKQEYVEVSIQPEAGGPRYRFAANPVEGLHYDAVMSPGEDISWNGEWKFAYQLNPMTADDPEAYPSWTAWFQIPFSDLGMEAPSAGTTWKMEITREGRQGERVLKWQGEARVSP